MYTTQKAIRAAFWAQLPQASGYYQSLRQNVQPCDIRVAFCDFVANLARNGDITNELAQRVTL